MVHFFTSVLVLNFFICCCLSSKKWITYKGNNKGLASVPADVPTDVHFLYLQENRITSLQTNSFSRFSECLTIDLEKNSVSEIQTGAFNGLQTLLRLALSYNNLSQIETGMWQGMSSLAVLELSYNQVAFLIYYRAVYFNHEMPSFICKL